MPRHTRESGPARDPLTWMLGGLIDLPYQVLDRLFGKRLEALIKRLPHR